MKELMPLENINAIEIFSEGGLDNLLEKIHKEAESHVPDLETDKGRKAIASVSAKVAKSKTYLDGLGKDMVSGWKNQAKVVDAERRKMRDDLDDLKVSIRKPLTDWEQAEKDRKDSIQKIINELIESGSDAVENYLSRDLQTMVDRKSEIEEIDTSAGFDELIDSAIYFRKEAIEKLEIAIEKRKQHDSDQAELEKLRTEALERERKEREDQLLKDREEREKRIADEAAENARKKAELAEAERTKRIEAEREEAIIEKEAAELAVIEEKKQAKIDADNAAKAEREKIEVERLREKEAAEKREANTRHRKKINNEAVTSLMTAGLTKDQAINVVTAIAKGLINNVTISY
jgi:hypothetical protein